MIQQEVFNSLSFNFRAIIYNFLEQIQKQINGKETDLELTFYQILKLIEGKINLYEKKKHNKAD